MTTINPAALIDVLEREHASEADGALMDAGCHYDYQAQTWRDGHDHAHLTSYNEGTPLVFCGADLVTCQR